VYSLIGLWGSLKFVQILLKKIIFSDEAHFWMNGYVNKQNCRIWDDTNPHEVHQNKMHPEKVTVWCGFWSGGIIGTYFFQNETGIAITVNGERYRSMISNFLWPKLGDMDTKDVWFQQEIFTTFQPLIIACFNNIKKSFFII